MRAACGLLLLPSLAFAEPRVVVSVIPAITSNRIETDDDAGRRLDVGIQLGLGYRIQPRIALGVHGATTRSERRDSYFANGTDWYDDYKYTSKQLGLSATFALTDRIWMAPWLGTQIVNERGDEMSSRYHQFAFGLGVGRDVVTAGRTRLTIYAGLSLALDDAGRRPDDTPLHPSQNTFWMGIGYRTW
jgi:hypothetical protein